jgi:hypothetical protein
MEVSTRLKDTARDIFPNMNGSVIYGSTLLCLSLFLDSFVVEEFSFIYGYNSWNCMVVCILILERPGVMLFRYGDPPASTSIDAHGRLFIA